jgi:hypothetical protein
MGASPTSPHRAAIELAALVSDYLRRQSEAGGGISCTADSRCVRRLLKVVRLRTADFVRRSGGIGMMIRIRKTRYRETAVLIRVTWSPERKRSVQQVICSFPAGVDRLPPELSGPGSRLSQRERSQADAWIGARVAERRREGLSTLGQRVTTAATELATALEDRALAPLALSGVDRPALLSVLERLRRAVTEIQVDEAVN